MAGQLYHVPRRPPPLYRLARALRRASIIVLVLILLFVGTVAYSAVSLTKSSSHLSNVTTGFGANDTVIVSGTLTLTNPGFYPVSDFTVAVHLANASNISLGRATVGPVNLPGGGNVSFPVNVFVPVNGSVGPGPSLLTRSQTLEVGLWANATYAYLFPVTVQIHDTRQWGAPFANLNVTVGTPTVVMGVVEVPVTLSFQNDASFALEGTVTFQILSPGLATCGTGSFPIDVASMTPYSETQTVDLSTGCNPAGGEVTAQYVGPGLSVALPPEPIP